MRPWVTHPKDRKGANRSNYKFRFYRDQILKRKHRYLIDRYEDILMIGKLIYREPKS